MTVSLQSVLNKHRPGPGTILEGTPYPEVVGLIAQMQTQDPRLIFDSLRPIGDEFWNMIDGRRAVGEIAEAVCLEFGVEVGAELFLPLVARAIACGAVSLEQG